MPAAAQASESVRAAQEQPGSGWLGGEASGVRARATWLPSDVRVLLVVSHFALRLVRQCTPEDNRTFLPPQLQCVAVEDMRACQLRWLRQAVRTRAPCAGTCERRVLR